MSQYSFEDVLKIDQALHHLATYEVTKGLIVIPKSQEEFMCLQEKIAQKFNYFKQLIQSRECTFKYIKQNVLYKNGPFPQSDPFDSDKLDPKQIDELEETGHREKDIHDFANHLLKSFLPSGPDDVDNLLDKIGLKITVKPVDSSETTKSATPPKKRSRKKFGPKKD